MNSCVGKKIANTSTPVTENTTIRIVSEIDWNVRSRHSAISRPSAPPATPDAAVTAKRFTTCPNEIPPKKAHSDTSPMLAARIIKIFKSPATSLPSTISRSLRSVISSSVNVRRSFSYEIAAAVNSGAKNSIRVNWSMANITYRMPPNRAITPSSRTSCQPMIDCQAVHNRMNRKQENDARQR